MYEIQYGLSNHRNCSDNLTQALRGVGMEIALLSTPLNIFMNVEVHADGALSIHPRERAPVIADQRQLKFFRIESLKILPFAFIPSDSFRFCQNSSPCWKSMATYS